MIKIDKILVLYKQFTVFSS